MIDSEMLAFVALCEPTFRARETRWKRNFIIIRGLSEILWKNKK